jgi:purine catabolism regulator
VYPTLAEVLELPVLRAAAPRVRAGSGGLDVRVRWVHVSEQRDPAGTLTGGELVLSTGMAMADRTTDPDAYVAALQEAGAVGLFVELGQHVRSLPTPFVEAARAARFPLVELSRAVRFVEVTEVIHARILHSQYARMQFTQRVHDTFRTLTVERGEVGRVLAETTALVGLPVVLEDLGHRALSFAGDVSPAALLQDWTARSRQVPGATDAATTGPEGWMTTPVGPRSRRWGRLVVPQRVVGDEAAEQVGLVLQHAADALTIGRLLGDDSLSVELEAQGELLQDLLQSTTLDEPALRARARALGLPTGGVLTVVVVGGALGDERARELVEAAAAAARTVQAPPSSGGWHRAGWLSSCRAGRRRARPAPWQRSSRCSGGSGHRGRSGGPRDRLRRARISSGRGGLRRRRGGGLHGGPATQDRSSLRAWRAADLGAQGLLWQLRTDPRLLSYVDTQLGQVLRLDDRARRQALETLSAYLEAGSVMTAFAARLRLSRPAAYARLARLRELLGRDLEQPRTRLSLHLALLALQQGQPDAVSAGAPTSAA